MVFDMLFDILSSKPSALDIKSNRDRFGLAPVTHRFDVDVTLVENCADNDKTEVGTIEIID